MGKRTLATINSQIPAAEYVRMSTDDRCHSIPIQQAAIRKYAQEKGYSVVATYSDEGRSGAVLRKRRGLAFSRTYFRKRLRLRQFCLRRE